MHGVCTDGFPYFAFKGGGICPCFSVLNGITVTGWNFGKHAQIVFFKAEIDDFSIAEAKLQCFPGNRFRGCSGRA